ncbi:MAG: copper-binding protein [Bacteriovorax sp.]|nr:copper-binding protein [Rhizobacter sp.]
MNILKTLTPTLILALAATLSSATTAQTASQPSRADNNAVAPTSASASAMTDGEIRKVDKSAKKLTIKHGPIKNLDMPGMTMVFQVKDAALLDKVKAGDKVRFTAEMIGGSVVVTDIRTAP